MLYLRLNVGLPLESSLTLSFHHLTLLYKICSHKQAYLHRSDFSQPFNLLHSLARDAAFYAHDVTKEKPTTSMSPLSLPFYLLHTF